MSVVISFPPTALPSLLFNLGILLTTEVIRPFRAAYSMLGKAIVLLLVGFLAGGCADARKDGIPLQALLDNDLVRVERALQEGASPDRFSEEDLRRAQKASRKGASSDHSPDSDPRWALVDNPFSLVIRRGSVEMAELLLRYGVDPDGLVYSSTTSDTFLRRAEKSKRYDIVAALIRAGVNLNTPRGGLGSALKLYIYKAEAENNAALENAVLERVYARDEKACPNVVDSFNSTAFRSLVIADGIGRTGLLLAAGMNPNLDEPREFSALEHALLIKDKTLRERVLQDLIRHGARIDLADAYVRQLGPSSFEEYVLDRMATEGLETPEEFEALLGPKKEMGFSSHREYYLFLIANGKLEMPREYEIIFNSPEKGLDAKDVRECVIRAPLQRGSASDDLVMLLEAMAHEDISGMKRLLETGMDVNEKYQNMSPIYYSWFYGKTLESRKAMLRLLVEYGAYIKEVGYFGRALPENSFATFFLDTQPPELYCIALPEHETCR